MPPPLSDFTNCHNFFTIDKPQNNLMRGSFHQWMSPINYHLIKYLFNDGQRPSPSVDGWYTLWMIYVMATWFPGRMWHIFPDICHTVEGKPWKNLNLEIDPTGDRTRDRCVRSNDVTPRLHRWSCKIFVYKLHSNKIIYSWNDPKSVLSYSTVLHIKRPT